MLGEKKIVAFSPELGNSNSGSDHFYPSMRILMKEILPQNLVSALYAIQRSAYYLRFFTLKNTYMECSIIHTYQHKFMDQNQDEKKELKICNEEHNQLYQFSNSIALKNTGFSDFTGKTKIRMIFNLNNLRYLSIKLDSGSNFNNNKINIKKRLLDQNITEIIENFNEIKIQEVNSDHHYLDINNDLKNIIFKENNSYYLISEIEQENIDYQNFNLIDIKLYYKKNFILNLFKQVNKNSNLISDYSNEDKLGIKENDKTDFNKIKHRENQIFDNITFNDNVISAYLENDFFSISESKFANVPIIKKLFSRDKTSFNKTKLKEEMKSSRLYFANDNYEIKLSQFEIFEIKKRETKEFSLLEGFFDLIIYSVLMFFLILSLMMIFYKIKLWLEKIKYRREVEELPSTSRTADLNGKKYSELQNLESSISRDGIPQSFQKTDF